MFFSLHLHSLVFYTFPTPISSFIKMPLPFLPPISSSTSLLHVHPSPFSSHLTHSHAHSLFLFSMYTPAWSNIRQRVPSISCWIKGPQLHHRHRVTESFIFRKAIQNEMNVQEPGIKQKPRSSRNNQNRLT